MANFYVQLLDKDGVLVEHDTLPAPRARDFVMRFVEAQLENGNNGGKVEFAPVDCDCSGCDTCGSHCIPDCESGDGETCNAEA